MDKQDSHIEGEGRAPVAEREDISGPVPRRHRGRLGMDVLDNPNGVGMPSKAPTISNGRKGW